MMSRSCEGERHHTTNMTVAAQRNRPFWTAILHGDLTHSFLSLDTVFSVWNALQYWGPDPGKASGQLKLEEVPDVESLPSGH